MVGRGIGGLGLLLAIACSGDDGTGTDPTPGDSGTEVDPAELVAELQAPGPYQVGYRTITVSWSDPLLTDGAPRELRVSLWYPTEATTGDEVRYQDVFPTDDALGNAPLAADATDLPVAVFSHGHQGYGEASSFLMEHLATHGWVVAAPDHLNNLTWDGDHRDTEIYAQRPLDLSAVLDWLDDPAGDELAGRLAPERLGLGHSFGGYTLHGAGGASYDGAVLDGCDDGTAFCSTMTPELAVRFRQGFREPRFTTLVAMDPGDLRLFGTGLADIATSELLLTADFDDPKRTESQPFWGDLDHPGDVWGSFPDLAHNGFTDVAGALDPPGVAPAEDGWVVIRSTVLAWGRAHLQDDAAAEGLFLPDSPLQGDMMTLQIR